MSWWSRFWSWLRSRLRRGRRQLRAEVRETRQELAEEVRDAGETLAAAQERIEEEVREAGQTLAAAQDRIEAEVLEARDRLLDLVDDLPLIGRLLPFDPVRNQYYGHGAFMGAAPALLADPAWRRILAFLMPDVFEDVRGVVNDGGGAAKVIPMFENNPVLCAYGAWLGIKRRRAASTTTHANDLSGMEWDVYMDGELVDAWEASEGEARRAVRDRLVRSLVIAHASTADVVQEAAGVDQYRDVRTTPKSRLGGVEIDAWLDLFGRALTLAEAPDLDVALAEMRPEDRLLEGDACARYTFSQPWEASRVVDIWRRASGQADLAIVLEVKSLRSTAPLVADIVRALNERGLLVRAVCAFKPEEVRGVSAMRQQLDGRDLPGPREIRFFHFAADLQEACEDGQVPSGQGILFNGASLLEATGDREAPYRVRTEVVDDLERYRERYGFDVGFYVQENDCDAAAADALSRLVAERPATFELGFAWGGLYDEAAIEYDGEDRRGFGSQGLLAWVSRGWRLPE